MDDDNEGNNADRNAPLDDEGGLRRNQVLIFGVILLGILAICLAVSMPSDLEFHDTELPTAAVPMSNEVNGRSSLSNVGSVGGKRNQTNSTARKKTLRNSEVSVEVKLLRDMAIQRKIQEYDHSNNVIQHGENSFSKESDESTQTGEEQEDVKVNSIVETFIRSEDFEDLLIDMEIHDAVQKLREEKGYKNRPSTLFDELFKRAEKEFIGDDEEELKLIKRVGEELEKKARNTLNERKRTQGQDLTEEPKKLLLADELLKLDFNSGSGNSDEDDTIASEDVDGVGDEVVEIRKTEL